MNDEKLLPFRWYGGKYSHLDDLLPLLPETDTYIEPFGGSGAVLLNREPADNETYNDIDPDVVTFFRVLCDQTEELIRQLALTPFAREEFATAIEADSDELDDMEQARLFFTRAEQARTGLAQTATEGRWAACTSMSRRGMAGSVSRWHGHIEQLEAVAERLEGVDIKNEKAVDLIQACDSDDALIYCDPTYPHEVRTDEAAYGYEMSDEDHRELAAVLNECEAKVAVSGYQCDLYEELYGDWHRTDLGESRAPSGEGTREESLWTTYEIPETGDVRQLSLNSY